ncbi:hypothetical protein PIROE2DRAFT_16446 [Piromyces sp. E2]|nr:hypothetical protein PIROE2DRAFT_16446 [Piromyces sp. E2]|eukprot:OUM58319.1 hypothetical protein PIROE2DRAFT_16446 [Piromyces sp. E2]
MFKYNLITVLLIFFFVKNIDAVILTKEEVLNLNVKDKNNCAEGSYEISERYENDFDLCNFHFICNRNNICSSVPTDEWETDSGGIEFPNAKGEIILQNLFKNCTVNSDCISNECVDGKCDTSWDYVTECYCSNIYFEERTKRKNNITTVILVLLSILCISKIWYNRRKKRREREGR